MKFKPIGTLTMLLLIMVSTTVFAGTPVKAEEKVSKKQLAQNYVIENYEKNNYQVPMRDGTKLHTQVYTPKDRSTSYPILFTRTPYRALIQGAAADYFGFLGPGEKFIDEGYIFVVQDVRGRYLSEGDFVVMRPNTADWSDPSQTDESTDAYDTIDWLVKNVENHNGKVGVHGLSYPGTFAALALVNAHPAIAAVVVEAPAADVFLGDDYHHNGAAELLYPFMWMNNVGLAERDGPSDTQPPPIGCTDIDDARGRSDGSRAEGEQENYYSFFLKMGPISNINKNCFKNKVAFWNGMMAHGTYDEFWKSRALGQRMTGIKKPAIIVAGSWFDDQDLYGALHTYKAINDQNPEVSVSLIMGPWNHDKWYYQKTKPWGKIGLPVKETGAYYRNEILLPFFNFHLKNKGEITLPKATVFESGTNTWKEYSEWPPKNVNMKQFYLGSQGKLLSCSPPSDPDKFDQFISDPANPVPQIPSEKIHGWTAEVMHWDQRFAAQRDDVLVYTGNVLENDLTVAGPVEVSLYVSTTGTDADWVVKLIDVYPDTEGDLSEFQMLVRGDIMRSKFRNSFEKPEPLVPGKITPVTFTMPDINHTFRKGHQLMIQVQSSWFPWFDRNPQQFLDIYKAKEEDFQKATHRVYHSKDHPSHIGLNVLSTSQK